jgi:TatD DNase family protein
MTDPVVPAPLVDTHCHLDFPDFNQDRDQVVSRSLDAGIVYLINVGSSLQNSRQSVALAESFDCVYAAVGIHPHDADGAQAGSVDAVRLLAQRSKVVAIGEIGLDYCKNYSDPKNQMPLFVSLAGLAKDLGLPVIVHSRDAQDDTLKVLRDASCPKVVVHCFSGDEAFLRSCLDLGCSVSFTGNITYKKAEKLRSLAKLVPADRLMIETDAPFLSPEGFRGQRNEPKHLRLLAEVLARERGVDVRTLARTTTANARAFFNLP